MYRADEAYCPLAPLQHFLYGKSSSVYRRRVPPHRQSQKDYNSPERENDFSSEPDCLRLFWRRLLFGTYGCLWPVWPTLESARVRNLLVRVAIIVDLFARRHSGIVQVTPRQQPAEAGTPF
jgi:hypothetical protein